MFLQNRGEPLTIDGLGQVVCRPERESGILVVDNRQHNYRNVGQLSLGLERGEHGPAVHPWHDHIQDDRVRMQLSGEPQPFLSVASALDAKAFLAEEALQQVARCRIVVNHQHGRRPLGQGCGC